ncbi:MAG: hypothetical protein COV66_09170 [Nitrospinae bacterium CG11_big_fil_rev_8_21_14_0_20_45_15]|nr:MAG: hypothetical protein COV66_09170 [Nitrospinae bacterium CG11_big_fil_rev_8_21_14_0_20_45_15]
MSNIIKALKAGIELEKKALEQYKEAIPNIENSEMRETIEKIVSDKNQQIDTLHWIIVAESGQLETTDTKEESAPEPAKGKCPFTGQFAAMGIDMSKMGEIMADPEKRAEIMGQMGGDMPASSES